MKISQILENAKAFLNTEEDVKDFDRYSKRGKTDYICIAAQRYIAAVNTLGTDEEELIEIAAPISAFIEQKIDNFNCGNCITLPNEIAKELLGMSQKDSLSLALKQKARHIWIDQLIAELKANPTRDLDIELDLN